MDDPPIPEGTNNSPSRMQSTERPQRTPPPSVLIDRESPRFWNELQERLDNAIDAQSELDVSGITTAFDGGFRVTLNRPGMVFQQTYTDLFYKRGAPEIRCSTLKAGAYTLRFSLTPDHQVAVTSSRGSGLMNTSEAAEYVMQVMLDAIGGK